MSNKRSLRIVGLFAGVGGIERGLHEAGHATELLCELDPAAQAVLSLHFPQVPLVSDVRDIDRLPVTDVVCAGFPCQDLSQAGRTAGIAGRNSGLVSEVFRLLETSDPEWVLLENVPFMLSLDRGRAMRHLTEELSHRGYTWAYRIVDSRSFGLPQRRKRVVMLASQVSDPRPVLFADEAEPGPEADQTSVACGFYWTEGLRGLGWAVDAVPTLKGGSTIGIPSPPAIRLPFGQGIMTPEIRDAERLQGFPSDWTVAAEEIGFKRGARWKLVGNAVTAPVARWVGENLVSPGRWSPGVVEPITGPWPNAGWGSDGKAFAVAASHWPASKAPPALLDFLEHGLVPLSERATAGFLARASRSTLRFPPGFLQDVIGHLERIRSARQLALVT